MWKSDSCATRRQCGRYLVEAALVLAIAGILLWVAVCGAGQVAEEDRERVDFYGLDRDR